MATDSEAQPGNAQPSHRPRSRRLRIFLIFLVPQLGLITAASLATGFSVHRYWQGILRDELQRDLTQKAFLIAGRINTDRQRKIEDLASQEGQQAGARTTVIDASGKVIADSEVPLAALENEGQSPEFRAALRGETGVNWRKNSVFGIPVLYVAVPVAGGALRLASPGGDLHASAAHARDILWTGFFGCLVAALALSALGSEIVVRRLRSRSLP